MKIVELLEAKNVGQISDMTWYHGSSQEFSSFDDSKNNCFALDNWRS